MNPISKIINAVKNFTIVRQRSFRDYNPGYSMFNHYYSDAYASAYPNIRAIGDEYKTVRPFAIDANGKPISHPIIDAIYHPNQLDSSVAFQEKVAVSTLVLPKTYILVWHLEGNQAEPGYTRGQTIGGFTFLEGPVVTRRDNKTYYTLGSNEYSQDEVLVLPGGVYAHSLYAGYSPSEAARRWAKLDDYIADFQAGFFENGAVPSGQFLITASSKEDYEDTVNALQARHRGARNSNNVTYAPRPVGPDGKPGQAKIEWIPFQQSNSEIGLKDIFEQTNNRIDLSFGVSQIIKGVDDAATYANAQIADKGFAKRVVYPKLLSNYTQFNHELNRITGGTGIAIAFKYEIPAVVDEEKVQAETHRINIETVGELLDRNYSLNTIVNALQLPQSYKLLSDKDEPAKIDNDKPDVDEGNEVEKSPDPEKIAVRAKAKKEKDPEGIYSPKGRYLGRKLPDGKILIKSPDKTEVLI